MKRFRGILLAFCFLLCGSKVFAEELSFCVLDDFLQIVTYKGPDTECSGAEQQLIVNSGEQGPVGPPGPEGPAGATGPEGPQGSQGPKGDQGQQGPQGVQGETGPVGPTGATGPEGPAGPEGPQGPAGTNGLNAFVNTTLEPPGDNCADGGIKVESGQDSIVSSTTYVCNGAEGPQGPQGTQGEAGPTGPQGPAGPPGPQGETGPQGPQGSQGETGPIGPTGATGPQGPTGTNGLNAFVNTAEEPPGKNCADGGVKIESGQDKVVNATSYVCNGNEGPQGQKGDPGPAGPQGPAGQAGATGPAGPPGPTGAAGPQGPAGPSGTTGPQGPAGPAGPSGPQGPEGKQGEEGPEGATGISILAGGSSGNLSASATQYVDMFLLNSNATESNVVHTVPVAGALTNLSVILNGAIGNAPRTYAFTVRKNSATPTTPVTCQIAGPSGTTCSDNTNCMLLNAGDTIDLMAVPASSPTARQVRVSAVFHPGATTCPP